MKRIISILMSITVILSMMPALAFATDGSTDSSTSAEATVTDSVADVNGTQPDSNKAESDSVAMIGETGYPTLKEAIDAVSGSATIKLIKNIEGNTLIDKDVSIVLDLNNTNYKGNIILKKGNLTIENGTLNATTWVYANNVDTPYNKLVIKNNVNIEDVDYGIVPYYSGKDGGPDNYGSNIEFHGTMSNVVVGIFVQGRIKTDIETAKNPVTIDVYGTIKCKTGTENESTVGIAENGSSLVRVHGANISGDTGVEVRAGRFMIEGDARVTGNAIPTKVTPNGNGTTTRGAGIGISQHTTKLPISVNIDGGVIEGYTGLYVTNPQNNDTMDNIYVSVENGEINAINGGKNSIHRDENAAGSTISIVKGIFSSNPKAYSGDANVYSNDAKYYVGTAPEIPDNSLWVEENGIYVEKTAVAKVNDKKYATLGEALGAANDSDTVTLLSEVTLTKTIDVTKGCTLDLNGHNVKATNCRAFCVKSGRFAIAGKGNISSTKTEGDQSFQDTSSVIRVGDNSGDSRDISLIVGENAVISSDYCYGVSVFGTVTNESVEINGSVAVTGDSPAIAGNGSKGYGGTKITVNGTVSSNKNYAIYQPQAGSLNINGTVNGLGGIEAKAGDTNVSIGENANVTATATNTSHDKNTNGTSTIGYAIALVENNSYAGGAVANIKGGVITGAIDIIKDDEVAAEKKAKFSITGGTFTINPTKFTGEANVYSQNSKFYVGTAPAHSSGMNNWVKGENGIYTETYVAPAPTPAPEKDPITNSGSASAGDSTTKVDATENTTVADGKAETKIDAELGGKIVDNAIENKSTDVKVDATTAKGDAAESNVVLPAASVKNISEKTQASVTVKTDNATVSLDKKSVDAVAEKAGATGEVKLAVQTKEVKEDKVVIELKIVTANGEVKDFKGGVVTVTVPVHKDMKDKELVAVYIDENGKYTIIDGKKNADGTFTFTTGHFSTYAVMTKADADAAVEAQNIAKAEVSGIKAKAYTGKAITQDVVVTLGDKTLAAGTDYEITYENNVKVGLASVKIAGKGKYEGEITKTFKINPKSVALTSVKAQKKALKATWKKSANKVTGYQVRYSTSKTFKSSKTASVKYTKKVNSKVVKNLKSNKRYYVKVRTYTKTADGTYYSVWSKAKSAKVK